MKNPRTLTLIGIVLIATLSRLVPHPWNLTPVTAIALFAGAHFQNKKMAYLLPLIAMLIGDLILGFYATLPVTYICLAAAVLIGRQLRSGKTASRVVLASVTASVFFFVVTNFVCWLTMPVYAKNLTGLTQCYALALPFFRNALAGDLFFSLALFGMFALSEKKFPALREIPQHA